MKPVLLTLIGASALFCATSSSQATLLGINVQGYNSYTVWDSFPDFSTWDGQPLVYPPGPTASVTPTDDTGFSDTTPNSNFGISGSSLALTMPITSPENRGLGTYNTFSPNVVGTDLLYTGGNASNFVIEGATGFNLTSFIFQAKRATNANALAFTPQLSLDGGISWLNASGSPTLASGSNANGNGDTTSGTGIWSVTTWTWNGLGSAESDSFILRFNGTGSLAIDTLAIAAIPEPSTWALIGLGGALAVFQIARRKKIA